MQVANASAAVREQAEADPANPETDPTQGMVPPHDLDAEAMVLSSVMLDPAALPAIVDFLWPMHFYAEAHRQIYEAAIRVREAGSPIDVGTVGAKLKDAQRLAQVGGMPYLGHILDVSPNTKHVRAYATIVFEKSRLRSIALLGKRVGIGAYGPIESVQEYADRFARATAEIARQTAGRRVEGNLETLKRLVRQLREASAAKGDLSAKSFGIRTGIHCYDQLTLGLHSGQKTSVVALPGRGKSTFGLQIAMNVAEQKIGVAMFSPEMTREEQGERQLANLANIDSKRIRQAMQRPTLDADEWRRLVMAMDRLEDIKPQITIYDDQEITVEDICAQAKRHAEQSLLLSGVPLGLIVVDHLHRLRPSRVVENKKRHEQLTHATKALATLAKELGVPVMELAQQRKLEIDKNGKMAKPSLGNGVFECNAVEQEAYNVVYIWRPDDRDRRAVKLLLVKVRGGGHEGEMDVHFEAEFSRFVDPNAPGQMLSPARQYVDQEPPGAFDDL